MGSSRLPAKMLTNIGPLPTIGWVVQRLQQCELLDGIVIATTENPLDDPLAEWARSEDVPVYRGSEDDVLQRVVDAQNFMKSDLVVEVTGDTPFVDPIIVDLAIRTMLNNQVDVVSTTWKQSFPMGLDVQVFSFENIQKIALSCNDPAVREHVSLFFYEHPEQYNIYHLIAPSQWHRPEIRLLLDYPKDLEMLRKLANLLIPKYGFSFSIDQLLFELTQNPKIQSLNSGCEERGAR